MAECPVLAEAKFGDEYVLPDPVQPARHDIVHQVVALGDLVEDIVDQTLLLVETNLGKAEIGFRLIVFWGFAISLHGWLRMRATIARAGLQRYVG
jgi:hypothetical protein